MRAVSIVVASDTGVSWLDGTSGVAIAITLSAGDPADELHPGSSFLGGGTSRASRAGATGTGSVNGATGCGGASNKKPMPKKMPTVAAATALRETR